MVSTGASLAFRELETKLVYSGQQLRKQSGEMCYQRGDVLSGLPKKLRIPSSACKAAVPAAPAQAQATNSCQNAATAQPEPQRSPEVQRRSAPGL